MSLCRIMSFSSGGLPSCHTRDVEGRRNELGCHFEVLVQWLCDVDDIDVLFTDRGEIGGIGECMEVGDGPFRQLIESTHTERLAQSHRTIAIAQPGILQHQMHALAFLRSQWTLRRQDVTLTIIKGPGKKTSCIDLSDRVDSLTRGGDLFRRIEDCSPTD